MWCFVCWAAFCEINFCFFFGQGGPKTICTHTNKKIENNTKRAMCVDQTKWFFWHFDIFFCVHNKNKHFCEEGKLFYSGPLHRRNENFTTKKKGTKVRDRGNSKTWVAVVRCVEWCSWIDLRVFRDDQHQILLREYPAVSLLKIKSKCAFALFTPFVRLFTSLSCPNCVLKRTGGIIREDPKHMISLIKFVCFRN